MIADDHQLIIDGIKSTIGKIEDFNFIGEAMNGLSPGMLVKKRNVSA